MGAGDWILWYSIGWDANGPGRTTRCAPVMLVRGVVARRGALGTGLPCVGGRPPAHGPPRGGRGCAGAPWYDEAEASLEPDREDAEARGCMGTGRCNGGGTRPVGPVRCGYMTQRKKGMC